MSDAPINFRQEWISCPVRDVPMRRSAGWVLVREARVTKTYRWGSRTQKPVVVAVMRRPLGAAPVAKAA